MMLSLLSLLIFAVLAPSIHGIGGTWNTSTCKIGVLSNEDMVREFGLTMSCDIKEIGTWWPGSQHSNPVYTANHFSRFGVPWREADVVLFDTSCYSLKSMQLMDHMGDKSIKITWNWKDLEKVWKEQINTAADKLRRLIRPDALVVGVGSHPHIYPCLIEKEKHTPASPPYALFRADPLQICRGAHFFDIPYYVKQSNFSISLAARKYLASFAGACSNEKNQGKHVRYLLHENFHGRSDMFVHCYRHWGGTILSKQQISHIFRRSVFCFLPAGDTPSSHRVPESLAVGCIPAIVGPPFSFLPLPDHIPWREFSVTFYVEELETLPYRELDNLFYWKNADRPKPADYDLKSGHYFRVKTVADIAPILESFPRSEILKMLNKVSQYRDYILHHGVLYNIMEEQMCNAWENFKTPD